MTFQDLQALVDYHYWARDRVLAAVERLTPEEFTRDMGNSFGSIRDTLAHAYRAEVVWRSRWEGEPPPAPAPVFETVDALRAAWKDHEGRMRALLDRVGPDGIQRLIEYVSMDGQPAAEVLWRMVQHVVNHASYHRGQVTTMLRQLKAAPPESMDLIRFYRLRGTAQAAG